MAGLGPDVWNPEGVKVLGTPVGSRVRGRGPQQTIEGRAQVVGCNPMVSRPPGSVADIHPMRRPEMPPHPPDVAPIAIRREYAQRHDDGMKLRLLGEVHEQDMARNIASLPMCMGGLGIRSAQEWHQERIGRHGRHGRP